jgi:hypothetical protein
MTSPRVCLDRRFPLFLGSANGITVIELVDIDSAGDISVGGKSTDQYLFNNQPSAIFIGFIKSKTFTYRWVSQILGIQANERVKGLRMYTQGIVSIIGYDRLRILMFGKTDGAIVWQQ